MAYQKRNTWYGLHGGVMKAFATKEAAETYEGNSKIAPIIKEAPKPAPELCEECDCDPCECEEA